MEKIEGQSLIITTWHKHFVKCGDFENIHLRNSDHKLGMEKPL